MILNLDRSTWKRVLFGDVIASVTERVNDPSQSGVERYVGLEHLDPGVMTVQRWASPDKVEAQKLRFQSGDVIFGRRRAYQRKVALAEFEGICSAHALVLRARPDHIDSGFLPVFLSSDYFLDRAISISVGSLSPTVNWRDLKVQEFYLPPLDEQKRIADLLWAIERQIRLQTEIFCNLERSRLALTREHFSSIQGNPIKLGQLLNLAYGKSLPERERSGFGHEVFGSSGVVGLHSEALVPGPGIVVGRKGNAGSVIYVEEDFFPIDTAYFVDDLNEALTSLKYAYELLKYCDLPSLRAQTAIPGLNRDQVHALDIQLASPEAQALFLEKLTVIDEAITSACMEHEATASLRASLFSEILGGN